MSEDYSLKDVIIRLDGIDARFDVIDTRLDKIDARLDNLEKRTTALEASVLVLDEKIIGLKEKINFDFSALGIFIAVIALIFSRLGNGSKGKDKDAQKETTPQVVIYAKEAYAQRKNGR